MYTFKKGDLIQRGTNEDIYTVTRDETKKGRVHAERGVRTYVFNSNEDDLNLYTEPVPKKRGIHEALKDLRSILTRSPYDVYGTVDLADLEAVVGWAEKELEIQKKVIRVGDKVSLVESDPGDPAEGIVDKIVADGFLVDVSGSWTRPLFYNTEEVTKINEEEE